AGFHILLPFVDAIRYRHSLKENALDIPEQICITKDNVQVHVDGVLYLKVMNPERASYGVSDYLFAITQLAQAALRSEIGKIELARTFEARTNINLEIVNELDKATEPWGIKVLRYEIKNITPPADVLAAMEKQMRAEREKRAVVLTSEGQRDAAINNADGEKQQVIKASEAKKQQQINEAEGQAAAILAVAEVAVSFSATHIVTANRSRCELARTPDFNRPPRIGRRHRVHVAAPSAPAATPGRRSGSTRPRSGRRSRQADARPAPRTSPRRPGPPRSAR